MLAIIREHNRLNGFIFSIAEFCLIAALLLPFVVYYWAHQRWWEAVMATGIVLNCVTISLTAVRQRARGEHQVGLRAMRRPDLRRQVAREHPSLARHTLTLTLSVLVPFLASAWALADVARAL
ncbi:hypothetical protein [Terrabacter sp. NPDC080008]|uniref:hypothetical protein n=1 Tax=Terrabacter sp. NPDC080008 TaxID=3155176 RepID=UPI0034504A15